MNDGKGIENRQARGGLAVAHEITPQARVQCRAARFDAGRAHASVVVVLDAPRACGQPDAARHMERIVRELLAALPSTDAAMIGALGSQALCAASEWAQSPEQWWRLHGARISLLQPVLRGLGQRPDLGRPWIIVLGLGPVYDLADLHGDESAARLILGALDGACVLPEQCPPVFRMLDAPMGADLACAVTGGDATVTLAGPGFMPVAWDNHSFVPEETPEGIRLRARGGAVTVGLSFLCPPGGEQLQVTVQRADGTQEASRLDSQAAGLADWRISARRLGNLTLSETRAWQDMCAGMRFECPVCSATHPAGKVLCDTEHPEGRPLFRCLQGLASGVVALETQLSGMVEAWLLEAPVTAPAPDCVVWTKPLRVYHLDAQLGRWTGRAPDQFESVGPVRLMLLDPSLEQ